MIRMMKISVLLALWWGLFYIIVIKFSLPRTDTAYKINPLLILLDPFVLTIGGGVSLISGVLTAPVYYFCLKDKDFDRSILLVLIIVSLELLLITPFNSMVSLLGSYVVLIFTLLFIKFTGFMDIKI